MVFVCGNGITSYKVHELLTKGVVMNRMLRATCCVAIVSYTVLIACQSDSGIGSNNEIQVRPVQFSAECAIPPIEHTFTMAKAGEVTASFTSLQPASGRAATIILIASNNAITVGAPGEKVTAVLPSGSHKLRVGHNHIEPLCSYTVQIDFSN